MKIGVSCDVRPCRLACTTRRFEDTNFLQNVANYRPQTQCNIPEDINLTHHRCENLKCGIAFSISGEHKGPDDHDMLSRNDSSAFLFLNYTQRDRNVLCLGNLVLRVLALLFHYRYISIFSFLSAYIYGILCALFLFFFPVPHKSYEIVKSDQYEGKDRRPLGNPNSSDRMYKKVTSLSVVTTNVHIMYLWTVYDSQNKQQLSIYKNKPWYPRLFPSIYVSEINF